MTTIIWILILAAMLVTALAADALYLLLPAVLLLLLPLLSVLLMLPGRKLYRLELEAPSIAQKHKDIGVGLVIRRKGKAIPGRILLRLGIRNCLTGETDTISWRPGKDPVLKLESSFCGCLELSAVKVMLSDWMGLLYLPLPCRLQKRVLVMPDTFPVMISPRLSLSMQDDCQEYSQTRKGPDRTETFQIRDYVPGDPLNMIHWKLSGKKGSLIVRESALPVDRSLIVFLDMASGDMTPSKADALTEAASSVCRALTDEGMTFHFSWSSNEMQFMEVTTLEEFSGALAAFLRDKSSRTAKGKGIFSLEEETGERIAGRILYFSAALPEDREALDASFDCQYFLCASESGREGNCFRFAADHPQEAFQNDIL